MTEADLRVGGPGSAYKKLNPFNTTNGIVHLVQNINTLSAALGLAQGSIHTGAARDNYETPPPGLRTSVDPRVIFDIGALARTGLSLTLREPIGLYITGYDDTGWTKPNGSLWTTTGTSCGARPGRSCDWNIGSGPPDRLGNGTAATCES